MLPSLLQLTPDYHTRVWGGQHLRPGSAPPIGEAWIVHEGNRVAAGPLAGRTLAEVTAEHGAALLGEAAFRQTGARFPLLIKLLDCADWLSVQVHPNDAQAIALEGSGQFGKTEAWHILEAEPEARLIAGVRPGAEPAALARAIREGNILDWVRYHPARAGDTVFMPAGTLHALGPGLLLYEVQQTSDITYRVFDWNRPASAGRALHIKQSAAVTDATATGQHTALPALRADDRHALVTCGYFTLELLQAQTQPARLDAGGQSFLAVTMIEGQAEIVRGAEAVTLKRFETALLPAESGAGELRPVGTCRALVARVP